MLRRDLLKGLFATTMVSVLPSLIKNSKSNNDLQHKFKIQFVGLGGAGCNIVEYAMEQNPNAQFAFINQRTDRIIPENVNYIDISEYKVNPYYSGFAMSSDELYEMEKVIDLFTQKETIYLIFAGLGGVTGSKLCAPILNHLRKEKRLSYLTATMPWSFEGNARNVVANFARNEINAFFNHNVYLLDLETSKKELGHLTIREAFLELDKRIYEISMGSIINLTTT